MSILNILLLLSILTLSPHTHALEEALGTPTTVTTSPIAVPIAQFCRVGKCVFAHLLQLVDNDKPVAHPTWLLTKIMKRLSYANHPRPS